MSAALAHVQQFEVLASDRVFVALAQEADIVGIFQLFNSSGVTSSLLDKEL